MNTAERPGGMLVTPRRATAVANAGALSSTRHPVTVTGIVPVLVTSNQSDA